MENKTQKNLCNILWGGAVIIFGEAVRQKTDYEFTSAMIQAYGTYEVAINFLRLTKNNFSRRKKYSTKHL